MKVYFIGGKSGLGKKVVEDFNILYPFTHNVYPFGSKDLNLLQEDKVEKFFVEHEPQVLISFASWNIDKFLHKYNGFTDIAKQVDVAILGTTNLVSQCLKGMREREFGRIILASSVLSKQTMIGTSVYSASKSYIETLVRVAAAENAACNISVNALRMGYMDGGLTYKIPEHIRDDIESDIPAGKFGPTMEIASTIGHIIDCPYINGSSIEITGGLNG